MTDAPALASAAALTRLLDAEAAARADLEGDYGGRCRALQPLLDALRETWEQWAAAEADGEEDPEAAATRIQQWWWARRGQRGVRQHRRRPSQQSIAFDADEPRPQYMRPLRTPSVQLQRPADAPAGGPRSWWVVAPDSPTAAQFPAGELTVEEDVGRVNTEAEERAARRQLWAAHGQAWDRLLRFAARRAAAEAAAAVTVQRFTRRWVTGAAQRRRHVRRAAVACEARREAEEHQMAAEDEASQALLHNGQAAVLQRAWRRCQRRLRRQARTATRLQAWWRAAVGRRRWPALQDHLEGLRTLERTEALERKWAAREEAAARAVLPLSRTDLRAVPGYVEAMAATLALRRRAWAAVRLQAAWRGRAARREAAARRAAWRCRAATRLQAVARGWAVRRWLPALRAAAEAEARRRLEGQWRLQTAAERRRAARVVQRAWRRHCSGAKPLWEVRTPLPGRPAAFRARPSAQAQANAADRQFALRQQQDTARRGVERLEAEEWQRLLDRIALGWAAPRLPERARGPAAQRRWAAAVRLQAACRGWRVRRRMPCSFADLLGERDTMARAEQFARRELEREEAAARRALPSSPAAVAAWLRAATPATPAGPLAQTWTAGLSASTAAPPPAPTPATLPPLPRPALRPPPPLPVPEPAWERLAVRATAVAPLPAGAPMVSAAELEDAYGRRAAPLWPGRPLDAAPIRPLGTVLQRQRQKVVARSHALPRRIDAIS